MAALWQRAVFVISHDERCDDNELRRDQLELGIHAMRLNAWLASGITNLDAFRTGRAKKSEETASLKIEDANGRLAWKILLVKEEDFARQELDIVLVVVGCWCARNNTRHSSTFPFRARRPRTLMANNNKFYK